MNYTLEQQQQAFLEKTCPEPFSGCWLWQGAVGNHGYGVVWNNDLLRPVIGSKWGMSAHRLAFRLFKGPLSNQVLHQCDTPLCCNPAHLYQGSHNDNMIDKVTRGRHHGNHILTSSEVLEIRECACNENLRYKEMANRYGVSEPTVRAAAVGATFKLLEGPRESSRRNKLTLNQVSEIRQLLAGGIPQIRVSQQFGVSPATICLISKNKTWNTI